MNDATSPPARPRIFRGWWIVLTCYLSQLLASSAGGWVFGILIAPMGDELHWTRSEIVGAVTLFTLLGGFLAAWFGPAVDRAGPRLLMTTSLLVGGISVLLAAGVQTKWQFYLVWAIYGVASTGFDLLGPVVALANWFVRRRPLAFLFLATGSATAGIALAPLMGLLEVSIGWRGVWVVMGLLICALAPLAWVSIRRRPDDLGLLPDGDLEPTSAVDAPRPPPRPGVTEREWTVSEALHTRSFWLTTAGLTLIGFPQWSIFLHMAPYVVSRGFSAQQGAVVVSIYGIGVLAGRPIYTWIIAHRGMHLALLTYALFYGASILVFSLASSQLALQATAVLLGVAISGGQQLRTQSFPDYFGRNVVGTLQGYSGIALTITRAVGPLLAAMAYDRSGSYVVIFIAFGLICFVGFAAFLFAPPPVHPLDRGAVVRS